MFQLDKIIDYSLEAWKLIYKDGEFFGLLEFNYSIKKNPRKRYSGYFQLSDKGSSPSSYWKNKWGFQYENIEQESLLNQIINEEYDRIYTLGRILESFFYLNKGRCEIKEINQHINEINQHHYIFSFPGLENYRRVFPPYPLLEFRIQFSDGNVESFCFHISDENHQKIEIKITNELKESYFYKMVIDYFHKKINQR